MRQGRLALVLGALLLSACAPAGPAPVSYNPGPAMGGDGFTLMKSPASGLCYEVYERARNHNSAVLGMAQVNCKEVGL